MPFLSGKFIKELGKHQQIFSSLQDGRDSIQLQIFLRLAALYSYLHRQSITSQKLKTA